MKKLLYLCFLAFLFLNLITVTAFAGNNNFNNKFYEFIYNSKSETTEIDIEIPQFKESFKQKEYNQKFIKQALDFAFEIQEIAVKDKESFQEEAWSFHPYQININYDIHSYNDIVSLTFDYYQYTGGAHGLSYRYSYNIDSKTGELLKLNDFLKRTKLTLEDINNKTKEILKSQPNDYYFDLDLIKISEDQNYYLEDSAIVIYFQQYEIAPYAFGFPEIKIRY